MEYVILYLPALTLTQSCYLALAVTMNDANNLIIKKKSRNTKIMPTSIKDAV
jgi:hypothetical protein